MQTEGPIKLSIIVPVYNLEDYISRTIESLLAIRCSYAYEILIINDGSTDNSEDTIKKFQNRYDNIHLTTIANAGVSNARNVGIAIAKGEYISFVDGDDTVNPDFYEIAVKELDAGGYDFVQGNIKIIKSDNSCYGQKVSCPEELTDRETMVKSFLGIDKKIHNSVVDKLFRAELIKNISFDTSISIAEDQKFVFDVINVVSKIKLLDCDAYNYYQRDSSAMHTLNNKKKLDQIEVFEYMEKQIRQPDIKQYIKRTEISIWIDLYTTNLKENNDIKGYYNKIKLFDTKDFINQLPRKERIKLNLIKYAPFIYKSYILIKEKNEKMPQKSLRGNNT